MNLARRILEGIHEVELKVTPEFRKGWPEPKVWQRTPVGTDQNNHIRYRVVWRWPSAVIATGLELFRMGKGYELNVWEPGSTVEPGSWDEAMASIEKLHDYPGGIYVYVEDTGSPVAQEVIEAESVNAYETIDDKEPGEESVVDHFLGYEGEPASAQKAWYGEGVSLSSGMKLAITNRPWVHMVHPSADVTELNPVMVLIENIPVDVSEVEKKTNVKYQIDDLDVHSFWAEKLMAWKVWPVEGQSTEEFERQIDFLLQHIDEVVDVAEGM